MKAEKEVMTANLDRATRGRDLSAYQYTDDQKSNRFFRVILGLKIIILFTFTF